MLYTAARSHVDGLSHWSIGNWLGLSAGEYDQELNTIMLPFGADPLTAIHELVHAVDDSKDWYLTAWANIDRAERLAHGFVHVLIMTSYLRQMETTGPKSHCALARMMWRRAWKDINGATSDTVVSSGGMASGPLSPTDIWDVGRKFGFRLSCSKLRRVYEDYLWKAGLRDEREFSGIEDITPESLAVAGGALQPCRCMLPCPRVMFPYE